MTVGEVGCYIAAVATVHRFHGVETNPSVMAANNNMFFSNTALMLTPPAPPGFTFRRMDFVNLEVLDAELREGRPVIVHVRTNNGFGGHFVTLISGSGGNYIMHDPWYGADLPFHQFYSVGIITSMRLFTR
jgi:hypothetical protein